MPAAVLSSFKTKYKDASDVKWEKAQEDGKPSYKAKWKIDGKKIKIIDSQRLLSTANLQD